MFSEMNFNQYILESLCLWHLHVFVLDETYARGCKSSRPGQHYISSLAKIWKIQINFLLFLICYVCRYHSAQQLTSRFISLFNWSICINFIKSSIGRHQNLLLSFWNNQLCWKYKLYTFIFTITSFVVFCTKIYCLFISLLRKNLQWESDIHTIAVTKCTLKWFSKETVPPRNHYLALENITFRGNFVGINVYFYAWWLTRHGNVSTLYLLALLNLYKVRVTR